MSSFKPNTVSFPRFKLFEGPKAATQKKEVALDVLGMQGALEFANPLFEYEIRFGATMCAEALGRIGGVLFLLVHELATVVARDASVTCGFLEEVQAPLKKAQEMANSSLSKKHIQIFDDIRKILNRVASELETLDRIFIIEALSVGIGRTCG